MKKTLAILMACTVLFAGCAPAAPEAEQSAPASATGPAAPESSSEASSLEASSSEVSSPEASSSEAASSEAGSSEAASSETASLEAVSPAASVPEPVSSPAASEAAAPAAEPAVSEPLPQAENTVSLPAEPEPEPEPESQAAAPKTANKKVTGMNFRSEVEEEILRLLNKERKAEGLGPLSLDEDLQSAARIRSRELCKTGHWDHTRPNGDSWSTVITEDVPITFKTAGENLCMTEYDDPSIDSAYSGEFYMGRWLNSPSHYENIVRGEFTHVGVGVYVSQRDGMTKGYATTIFAELP